MKVVDFAESTDLEGYTGRVVETYCDVNPGDMAMVHLPLEGGCKTCDIVVFEEEVQILR